MKEFIEKQCDSCNEYFDSEDINENNMCYDCQIEQDKFNNSEGKGI